MSTSSYAAGSLSFLMDIIPVIVIIILIIAFSVGRHKYHKEKKELDKTISECEKVETQNKQAASTDHNGDNI